MVDRDKHIWEGWTVGDFIDDIEPFFNQCGPFMDKQSLRHANIARQENLIPMKEVQLNLAACYVLKVGINPKNLWITAMSVM